MESWVARRRLVRESADSATRFSTATCFIQISYDSCGLAQANVADAFAASHHPILTSFERGHKFPPALGMVGGRKTNKHFKAPKNSPPEIACSPLPPLGLAVSGFFMCASQRLGRGTCDRPFPVGGVASGPQALQVFTLQGSAIIVAQASGCHSQSVFICQTIIAGRRNADAPHIHSGGGDSHRVPRCKPSGIC